MNLIASVDENWGLGYQGQLLARVPEDLRHFRRHTLGKVVVMGQTTLYTLPQAAPLPERVNIILSDDPAFTCPGAQVVNSLGALGAALNDYRQEVYVIGGASVYQQLLPYCHCAYLTRFHARFPADRFLADLDALPHWTLVGQSGVMDHQGLAFTYQTYRNSQPEAFQ